MPPSVLTSSEESHREGSGHDLEHRSSAKQLSTSPSCGENSANIASRVLASMGIWLASAMLVAWFEFGIFWNLPLLLFAMNLNAVDQLLVVGSLLARILVVTSPMLVMLVFATKEQWHWKWKAVAWTAHFAVLAWIIVDCGLQCVTGANLWHYAEKAMTTEDLAVGGDVSLLLAGIKSALSVIALQIAAVAIGFKLVTNRLRSSRWKTRLSAACNVSMLSVVGLVLLVVAGRHFVTQRPALEQLYGTITLRTWLFHPDRIAEYGEAAFGRECESDFENLQPTLTALFGSDVCRPNQTAQAEFADQQVPSPFIVTRSEATELVPSKTDRPNIILLLTESFRYDALTEEHMPKLFDLSKTGLVGHQHSTNSNCSEFGAFTALYGRYALCYDDALDQQVPSVPMGHLNQLGYRRQMVNSCSVNFSRMNEFLSDLNFDRISIHSERGNPWHDNDRQTLSEIVNIVQTAEQPQFVFSILMATHYSYDYPEEYDQNSPNGRAQPSSDAANHEILEDRYWKSVSFLDEQISNLIESVRDTNTVVIVTGDHGESFLDDGFLCHGTRLSQIQTRTPLLIVGPGIPAAQLNVPTAHLDLMPTMLDLAAGTPSYDKAGIPSPGRTVFDFLPQRMSQNVEGGVKWDRSQFVVQARVNDWEIGLQHPEGILSFQTSRSGLGLKMIGFLNESGRVDQKQKRRPEEIPVWNERLETALKTAAKGSKAAISPVATRQ